MSRTLTQLQRSVLRRLSAVGLEDLADRARTAWRDGQPLRADMRPFEAATIEGARLDTDFDQANAEASTA